MLCNVKQDQEMIGRFSQRKRKAPWAHLLGETLLLCGGEGEFLNHRERPWASATFSGTRHTITLAFSGTAEIARAEQCLERLPDHEFAIPGQLVADATVASVKHSAGPPPRMVIEAEFLLLDDC